MTQKEKLARMQMYVQRIEITARNISNEGRDYDQQWHKKYVIGLNDIANEMKLILKSK